MDYDIEKRPPKAYIIIVLICKNGRCLAKMIKERSKSMKMI